MEPPTAPIKLLSKWTSETLSLEDLPRVSVQKIRWLGKYEVAPDQGAGIPLQDDDRPPGPQVTSFGSTTM